MAHPLSLPDNSRLFILNFIDEQFFQPVGEVARVYHSSLDGKQTDYITINDVPYCPETEFMIAYLSLDDITAMIFVYGEPEDSQLIFDNVQKLALKG